MRRAVEARPDGGDKAQYRFTVSYGERRVSQECSMALRTTSRVVSFGPGRTSSNTVSKASGVPSITMPSTNQLLKPVQPNKLAPLDTRNKGHNYWRLSDFAMLP